MKQDRNRPIPLYAGIDLMYADAAPPVPSGERTEPVMRIYYCRAGQLEWQDGSGESILLNPGDFLLYMPDAEGSFRIPAGGYEGLILSIDLQEIAISPPELLADVGTFSGALRERFGQGNGTALLEGNERTEHIFSAFFGRPEQLRRAYQRVMTLELMLYLMEPETAMQNRMGEYSAEQADVIREIHDQLLLHIGERITIEELSRQYLLNPTTLKKAFKTVYGTSLAAHIKEHRMEQAAKLLRETDLSIAEIAQAVGYDSQSKFTTAFKAFFQVLPREYRRRSSPVPQMESEPCSGCRQEESRGSL